MPSDGTVLATLPRMILGYLGGNGFDAPAIAAEAGLAGTGCVDALWNLAVRKTRDGALGLRFTQSAPRP